MAAGFAPVTIEWVDERFADVFIVGAQAMEAGEA
jgi:hypothetical protein